MQADQQRELRELESLHLKWGTSQHRPSGTAVGAAFN